MPELKAGVGVSEKWDAREAGREVAKDTLEKLGKDPDFFLLFSTIHYKKYGGFQEFLDGVWEVLPKGTPLIGGTVAGFITPEDCFVHGAAGMAVSYPNMDVAVGIGRNTKRNPKKAAKECAEMIKKGLKGSKYKNKFLINIMASPVVPHIPFFGRINVVKSKLLGDILSHVGVPLFSFFGEGIGEESGIIDELASMLPEYHIFGGSAGDDGKMFYTFQFLNSKIYKDIIVSLGCASDLSPTLSGGINLKEIGKSFRIMKTVFGGRIIAQIENQSARSYFFKNLLDLPEEIFGELERFYYKAAMYFPITFQEDRELVTGIGGIFGDNLIVAHRIKGEDCLLLSVCGRDILTNVQTVIESKKRTTDFTLIFFSAIYIYVLGREIFHIKEILNKHLNKPFLAVCPIMENIRTPSSKSSTRIYSFNKFCIPTK